METADSSLWKDSEILYALYLRISTTVHCPKERIMDMHHLVSIRDT